MSKEKLLKIIKYLNINILIALPVALTSTSSSVVAGATSAAWVAGPWPIPSDRRSVSSIRSTTIHGRTIVRRVMTIRPRGQAQTVLAHTAGHAPRFASSHIHHTRTRGIVVCYLFACTEYCVRACMCVCVCCVYMCGCVCVCECVCVRVMFSNQQ